MTPPESERGPPDDHPAFLVDANMPRSSADLLRKEGFDAEDVRDVGLGAVRDEANPAVARSR